jgi:purine-binding chemotaxis protein CheW
LVAVVGVECAHLHDGPVGKYSNRNSLNNFSNNDKQKIVVFSLEEPRYALFLSDVVKVERAVETTPLPMAPAIVSGIINYHGEIIPVVDIRKLFRLPQREIHLEDQFIIARMSQRRVVLVVESVNGVYDCDHREAINAGHSLPFTEYVSGIVPLEIGIVLITDLEKFLSLDEEHVLEAALSEVQG